MKSVLLNTLFIKNQHSRDKHITFYEEGHKYIIDLEPDATYTSVTTWLDDQFEKFDADKIINKMMSGYKWKIGHKYWGMTSDEIKSLWETNKNVACEAGTALHFEIECFNNNNHRYRFNYTNKELTDIYIANNQECLIRTSIEWQYYINFVIDYPNLKPYRTEWTVFNEDIKISGSIDMVYENNDGTLSIYDWKRSKDITRNINTYNRFGLPSSICHLPDSNFWHYALQLNMYKYILETKYNKIVKDLYLVRLHPEEHNYELIQLPILSTEINDLVQERTNYLLHLEKI